MAISTIGVVGAGAMGAGIAQTALAAGLKVILFDTNAEALGKAKVGILARIARLVEKGQFAEGVAATCDRRLRLASSLADLAPVALVIEAIVEQLEPKQMVFRALEKIVTADTVLATNTSSLSIAAIASGCAHRERICGLHFFNPVPSMKLVEVIASPATSAATNSVALELVKTLGKVPVQVKDSPGFLVNLCGRAYYTEALQIVQEGVADVATVDRIMRDAAGFRMGPFELMDLTGIDINLPTTKFIYEGFQHDPRLKTTTLHELMFNAGRYGRKTGQGYHDYSSDVQRPDTGAQGKPDGFQAFVAEASPSFELLRRDHGLIDGHGAAVLIAPVGEDAATATARLGLDPAKVVAIDFTGFDRRHLTLMAPLGGSGVIETVANWLRGQGFAVDTIKDSPGFVAQRVIAMIANLGCELAQIGVGAPEDIDLAMKLAQNYPRGPLEWAAHIGPTTVHAILASLQAISGSDRYRPSLWLRRRALLGCSIYQRD
jgi:3-hydroxybutyryl-CoA dehydrogenase